MTEQRTTMNRREHLERALRLTEAALTAITPTRDRHNVLIPTAGYTVRIVEDATEDGEAWVEVGDGLAALEPVEVTVRSGRGGRTRPAVYWRVHRAGDASDPTVGLVGTELYAEEPPGYRHPWHLPGRITAALSHDLGIDDDDLHAQLDRHGLVVARCWGQNGCYAYLKDAVRHVIHALVDGRIEVAMENAAYALEQEASREN